MHGLLKALLYTAPVFVVCLVLYFALNSRFNYDFQVESVRFEKEFNQLMGLKKDKWLQRQEEEIEKMAQKAKKEDQELEALRKALEDTLRENNATKLNRR